MRLRYCGFSLLDDGWGHACVVALVRGQMVAFVRFGVDCINAAYAKNTPLPACLRGYGR